MKKAERLLALTFIMLIGCCIGFLTFQRQYFNFGVETDYLGTFVPEAKRFLEGKPLLLKLHGTTCILIMQNSKKLCHK